MTQQITIGKVATSIFTDGDTTKIIYHSTAVVSFNDKKIILNTGGWNTNTTKVRMNQASNTFGLGFQVYQKNYAWLVAYKGVVIPFDGDTLQLDR